MVDSLHHWRQFLMGKHFEVFTDQQTVSFTFDQHTAAKLKINLLET